MSHTVIRVRSKDIQYGALMLFVVYSFIVVVFIFNEIERHEEEKEVEVNRVKMVWDAKRRQDFFLAHEAKENVLLRDEDPIDVKLNSSEVAMNRSVLHEKYFLAAFTAPQMEYSDENIDDFSRDLAALKQWLHYVNIAGVEHVYLCDCYNNEHPERKMEKMLNKFMDKKLISYTSVPYNNSGFLLQNAQAECYKQISETLQVSVKWLISINMYEYPYVIENSKQGFLKRHLENITSEGDYTDIRVNYLHIDGPVDSSQKIVIDRGRYIRKSSDEILSPLFKPISRKDTNKQQKSATKSDQLVLIDYARAIRPDVKWQKGKYELVEFQNVTISVGSLLRSSLRGFNEPDAYLAS